MKTRQNKKNQRRKRKSRKMAGGISCIKPKHSKTWEYKVGDTDNYTPPYTGTCVYENKGTKTQVQIPESLIAQAADITPILCLDPLLSDENAVTHTACPTYQNEDLVTICTGDPPEQKCKNGKLNYSDETIAEINNERDKKKAAEAARVADAARVAATKRLEEEAQQQKKTTATTANLITGAPDSIKLIDLSLDSNYKKYKPSGQNNIPTNVYYKGQHDENYHKVTAFTKSQFNTSDGLINYKDEDKDNYTFIRLINAGGGKRKTKRGGRKRKTKRGGRKRKTKRGGRKRKTKRGRRKRR